MWPILAFRPVDSPTQEKVAMTEAAKTQRMAPSLRRMLLPLALAQFICSFAGSNMNVMINDISKDLHTTVQGVQIAITLFLLVMAALMIPGGKLTDRWGRKRCFTMGLSIYAVGALLSAIAPGLGVLILGNSILEGVGTALLIPPVYILTTMLFHWPGPRELIHPLCESDPQDGGRRTTQHEETEAHPRADHPQAGRGREAPG